jgi:hypothetical protein
MQQQHPTATVRRSRNSAQIVLALAGLLLAVMPTARAQAQQTTPSAEPSVSAAMPRDLAKSTHNPFEDTIKQGAVSIDERIQHRTASQRRREL